jgi:DNA-directed RNA polymerase II subunit RPB2
MDMDNRKTIDLYFSNNKTSYFVNHHLDSFNTFISENIPHIIKTLEHPYIILKNDEFNEFKIEVFIGGYDGKDIKIEKPDMNPNEARLLDKTYKSTIDLRVIIDSTLTRKNRIEKVNEKKKLFDEYIKLGEIPIMLHSKLCHLHGLSYNEIQLKDDCPFDQGGYFIVNGKEKVVMSQDRMATNRILVRKLIDDTQFTHEAMIRCTSADKASFTRTIYAKILRNKKEFDSNLLKNQENRGNAIVLDIPNLCIEKNKHTKYNCKNGIPLFIIFRALGIESDKDIIDCILQHTGKNEHKEQFLHFLKYSINDSNIIYTRQEALLYLQDMVSSSDAKHLAIQDVLMNSFFPNMGKSINGKIYALSYLSYRLISNALGIRYDEDRDNFKIKRIDLSGFKLTTLFQSMYNNFRWNVKNNIDRFYNFNSGVKASGNLKGIFTNRTLPQIFDSSIITDGISKSFRGSWPSDAGGTDGLVQDLNRLSYMGYVSHVRRVTTKISKVSKSTAPHLIHLSQWGIICPIESPDGGKVGLIQHLSVLANVTFGIDQKEIVNALHDLGVIEIENVNIFESFKYTKILLNGNLYGIHNDPHYLVNTIRLMRRCGIINIFTSISWEIENNEVYINIDRGRCCRPLYILDHINDPDEKILKKRIDTANSWNDLVIGGLYDNKYYKNRMIQDENKRWIPNPKEKLRQSCIEFIDAEEANTILIKDDALKHMNMNNQPTHSEIHPSTILSMYTNTIPLAHHNPAARSVFSGQQGKQALGIYSTAFHKRLDTSAYILHYPQKALVQTMYNKYTHSNYLPNGQNVIVAIATYSGYNQEDAIIMNRSAIERGLFQITAYKSKIEMESSNYEKNSSINFLNPEELKDSGEDINLKYAKWNDIHGKPNLQQNGLPVLNTYISDDDVYLGKVEITKIPIPSEDGIFSKQQYKKTYKDLSLVGDKNSHGYIDKLVSFQEDDMYGNKITRVKIGFREMRSPSIGDKHGSRHGQKGTVGIILDSWDMPFGDDGVIPDIIINPHAFPSRMTVGHVMESLMGKAACAKGWPAVDGTIFENHDMSVYSNTLLNSGFHPSGDTILYNGRTGEQITTSIYVGPTYYFRLKHMVTDKRNERGKSGVGAPITNITRQPVEGRSNNGGLRIGNMEKDAIISHGMKNFLLESILHRSDGHKEIIDIEGNIPVYNLEAKTVFTPEKLDGNPSSPITVHIPYAFKVLKQELESLAINMKLLTNSESNSDIYDEEELFDDDYGYDSENSDDESY